MRFLILVCIVIYSFGAMAETNYGKLSDLVETHCTSNYLQGLPCKAAILTERENSLNADDVNVDRIKCVFWPSDEMKVKCLVSYTSIETGSVHRGEPGGAATCVRSYFVTEKSDAFTPECSTCWYDEEDHPSAYISPHSGQKQMCSLLDLPSSM